MCRVLTFAVSGVTVKEDQALVVLPKSDSFVSFNEAQDTGFFSLRSENEKNDEVIVQMPLMMVAAQSVWSGLCDEEELNPFTYGWENLEDLAITSLRMRANAHFYKNNCKPVSVSLSELRPGAYLNTVGKKTGIKITSVIPCAKILTNKIKGSIWGQPWPVGVDGIDTVNMGSSAECVVAKTVANEPGIDGIGSFANVLFLTQSKSVVAGATHSTPMGHADYSMLVVKAAGAKDRIGSSAPATAVVDLFTLRKAGTKFVESPCSWSKFTNTNKTKSTPADEQVVTSTPVVVTTRDKFADVVGPGFAQRLTVLDLLDK
jgi:hypothetical protein